MTILTLAIAVLTANADSVILEERIDLFDPVTGAFLGAETTRFAPDGRRLRLEVTDERGSSTLLFFVLHDERGRERGAIYFEDGSEEPSREVFEYESGGRVQTVTYFYEPGVPADRTRIERDAEGRDVRKYYYRSDGSLYGEEDVLWAEDGKQVGWDFRYVGREGGVSFRYEYTAVDAHGKWLRRVRLRDGVTERLEVRSLISSAGEWALPTPVRLLPGQVSTEASESSPSFTRDGKTMVFARYGDDWTRKEPFIAYLDEEGWRVERLDHIGTVYNLAISPDGSTLIYSVRSASARELFRLRRAEAGWSAPESLTVKYGLTGTYPCMTDEGDLIFFDATGPEGAGIYRAPSAGDGFGPAVPAYVPPDGPPFDAYAASRLGSLLVTRCFDETCLAGPENGIWQVQVETSGVVRERKLGNLPYGWGVQPVQSLGLLVFTDGEDILAVPLEVSGVDPDTL